MSEPIPAAGLSALRDFFSACNAEDLRSAALEVATHFRLPLDPATDWQEVEYDFNRLFVGPMAVPAPPYASAYETEPTLMGPRTLAARAAYQELGLSVPDQGTIPDDHLAFELDAVAACEDMLADNIKECSQAAHKVRTWLLKEHMPGWVPQFVTAVRAQPEVGQPVTMVILALEQWLADAAQSLPDD